MKNFITRFPMIVFLLTLLVVFAVIFAGKQMRSEDVVEKDDVQNARVVDIFSVDGNLQAPVTGEVDRADTVVLRATANGIVTRALTDGASVYRGQEVVKLSDTYAGTSQADVSAAIANRNYTYQKETIDTQRDLLRAQDKEINKADDRQAKIARKQNFLQQRSAELSFDTAKLQASQAYAVAAMYRTVAPLAGTVEEVTVRVGDTVQAGQIIAILKASNQDDVRIVAHVGAERAAHVDVEGKVIAMYEGREIPLEIVHIAESGSDGQSYALTFRVAKDTLGDIGDGAFVEINVPMQSDNDVLVPLDSVRFGAEKVEVYVLEGDRAMARTVELGDVIGSYVVVTTGLEDVRHIIADRRVTDGENVIAREE